MCNNVHFSIDKSISKFLCLVMNKYIFIFLFITPLQIFSQKNESDLKSEETFTIVEIMPEFPGGNKKINTYLNNQVDKLLGKSSCNCKVYVNFVVDENGKTVEVEIRKGVNNKKLNKLALEIVQSMPIWKPGKQKGENVRVSLTVPVTFDEILSH